MAAVSVQPPRPGCPLVNAGPGLSGPGTDRDDHFEEAIMETQSEQFEEQARRARARLSETLEALRARMTAGQVVDQLADYAGAGPPAQFFRNLTREAVENPLPIALIGFGIAWLIIAGRLSRTRVEYSLPRQVACEEGGNERLGRPIEIGPAGDSERLNEAAAS
jgi:hypothetical protein